MISCHIEYCMITWSRLIFCYQNDKHVCQTGKSAPNIVLLTQRLNTYHSRENFLSAETTWNLKQTNSLPPFDPFNPLNRLLGPCEPFDLFRPFCPSVRHPFRKNLRNNWKKGSEDCSLLPENTVTKYPNNKFRKLINEKSSNISSKLFGLITRLKPQTTK